MEGSIGVAGANYANDGASVSSHQADEVRPFLWYDLLTYDKRDRWRTTCRLTFAWEVFIHGAGWSMLLAWLVARWRNVFRSLWRLLLMLRLVNVAHGNACVVLPLFNLPRQVDFLAAISRWGTL